MSYELEFKKTALKEWKKLGSTVQQQFKKKLSEILENPHIQSAKLSGANELYKIKLRQAGYRLVYEVNDSSLSFSSHRVEDYYSRNLELTKLPVEDVNFTWTQQQGNDRRGAWMEADFGAAIRALMEVLSEDDF